LLFLPSFSQGHCDLHHEADQTLVQSADESMFTLLPFTNHSSPFSIKKRVHSNSVNLMGGVCNTFSAGGAVFSSSLGVFLSFALPFQPNGEMSTHGRKQYIHGWTAALP
jgi:hypothetical protein